MPAFQKLLLNYPQATLPGMQENFFWLRSLIEKKWTYILVHILSAPDGLARAVVRREYYASTGYNASQSYGDSCPFRRARWWSRSATRSPTRSRDSAAP